MTLLWHDFASSLARTFFHSFWKSKNSSSPRSLLQASYAARLLRIALIHLKAATSACRILSFMSAIIYWYSFISLPIREVRFTHLQLVDHHEPFKTWHYTCPLLFLRYSGLVACNFVSEFTQDPACAPSGPGNTPLFIGLIHSKAFPADASTGVSSPEYSPWRQTHAGNPPPSPQEGTPIQTDHLVVLLCN